MISIAAICLLLPVVVWCFDTAGPSMIVDPDDAPRVGLGIYIESLCPYCRAFITNQFWPTWKKINSIMNVTIVPYGNAKKRFVNGHWRFTCQHGPDECLGDVIQTCSLNLYGQSTAFQFIVCIEATSGKMATVAKKCASAQRNVNYTRIMQCANSQEGERLQYQMAVATDSLSPRHRGVPWITVNDVYTADTANKARNNLLRLICTTYQGPKPAACDAGLVY
jgi:interferon, gamma-inducible protein 30